MRNSGYNQKFSVEKTFRFSKTGTNNDRLLVNNEEVLKGRVFCLLISTNVYEIIEKAVAKLPKKFKHSGNPITVSNFLNYLSKINIDEVELSGPKEYPEVKQFLKEINDYLYGVRLTFKN
ncbi:hypothetical protein CKF54_06715 [Psittacicella hinzii]|uniref:Uncharacterized protein n=1 Tax=Psittacicella hinzii TaxID=2028575 RepID=A0A3A1Y1V0_9GAMM|nr:hypothetical protein [Psittacicella hinzii]RIY31390.1 hypothetical protein CKF54_06715 [Psittacicella hinzii]